MIKPAIMEDVCHQKVTGNYCQYNGWAEDIPKELQTSSLFALPLGNCSHRMSLMVYQQSSTMQCGTSITCFEVVSQCNKSAETSTYSTVIMSPFHLTCFLSTLLCRRCFLLSILIQN